MAGFTLGPLARHMGMHISAMNVAAPLIAAFFRLRRPLRDRRKRRDWIWPVTIAQLALLWAWHSPALQHSLHGSSATAALLHVCLLLAGFFFWLAVIDLGQARWRAAIALLVTGKLVCLLGAILVFAPRLLFEVAGHMPGESPREMSLGDALADQQLAGLLMITACPLSYVLAAVILAAQALGDLRRCSPAATATRSIQGT